MHERSDRRISNWGAIIGAMFGGLSSMSALGGSAIPCIHLPGGFAAILTGDLDTGGFTPGARGVVVFAITNAVFYGALGWAATRVAVARARARKAVGPRVSDCPVCGHRLVGSLSATCPSCGTAIRGIARGAEHHCVRCGYDLTGNESGVCPECGGRPGVDDG